MSSCKSSNSLSNTIGKLNDDYDYRKGPISTSGPTLSENSRSMIKGTRWEVMDNEIDANLGKYFLMSPLK